MSLRTARVAAPPAAGDGRRLLITRYRPRGVRKGEETWDRWDKRLAPPPELLDAWLGKVREGRKVVRRDAPRISWEEFTRRFQARLQEPDARAALEEYRAALEAGQALTLLCYCEDEARCHRSLVARALSPR